MPILDPPDVDRFVHGSCCHDSIRGREGTRRHIPRTQHINDYYIIIALHSQAHCSLNNGAGTLTFRVGSMCTAKPRCSENAKNINITIGSQYSIHIIDYNVELRVCTQLMN